MIEVSDAIHILHIDDEPDLSEMVSTFLEREDARFTVQTATTADEGLDILSTDSIDCIVSDYDMPGQNGIEFLEAVREEYPDLPFILYTGKGSEEVASEAISSGVTDYLQKGTGTDQYTLLANRIANAVTQARAEREVTRTREYFGTILEHASDYVMVVDENAQVDYISPAVERVLGYTPDELQDSDAFETIHPKDLSKATAGFADVLKQPDQVHTVAYRVRHADGSWRWLEVRGRNRLNDPIIEGIIVSARDITEKKEREQELENAKAQLENAIKAGAVGTWEWHVPEDQLVVGNEFARRFGVDPELAQKGVELDQFMSSIHKDDREQVEEAIDAALEACGEYETEYRVWDAENELNWVLARGYVECDDDGTPVRFPGVLVNITERKQVERELERQNKRLNEFASVLSHDLRNPLNVAEGQLELAHEEYESDHLEAVSQAHERIRTLIDNVLTLARDGESVSDLDQVALTAVIEQCWRTVETEDASLVIEVDRQIRADESRLQQVFENLIRNAVEHGGEDVTVTVGELNDGFYIEDDGPGIPLDERETVFNAGYSSTDEGTGFGLSIVKQVVEAHGWQIQITDGTDGGTRFEITGVEFVA